MTKEENIYELKLSDLEETLRKLETINYKKWEIKTIENSLNNADGYYIGKEHITSRITYLKYCKIVISFSRIADLRDMKFYDLKIYKQDEIIAQYDPRNTTLDCDTKDGYDNLLINFYYKKFDKPEQEKRELEELRIRESKLRTEKKVELIRQKKLAGKKSLFNSLLK